ncbi:MAG TPA: amino acid permease [Vicinamibacterales bacterium]|nr:amino acid permease [Vicinamibacterales bacterium]
MSQSPALLRQLGVGSATALVVSNMVGSGIFSTSGFLAGDLGTPALFFLIWAVGALVGLAGAFCYAELGVNFPSSGGEYVYLTQGYGPVWGFMSGWASLFAGFSAPIAAAALTVSNYAGYFVPAFRPENALVSFGPEWFRIQLGGAQVLAAILIAALTALNIAGILRAARFQNVMTIVKIVVLVAFVLLAFAAGDGNWSNFTKPIQRESSTPLFAQFAISLCFIYLSYSGWNAATYVAEELRQPARTLPAALSIGTALVAVLYLVVNVVFLYAMPLSEMKGVFAVGAKASSKLFGAGVAGVFSALMAISLIPSINAMVTVGPRVYYAMAKNGAFLAFAGRVDERWHTPVPAILLQGGLAILMTATPFPSLLQFIGFTLNLFTVLAVASLFKFRRREGWQKLPVVSFLWPLLPAFYILVGLWIVAYGIRLIPVISMTTAAMMAIGALIYHFRLRSGKAHHAFGD